MKILITGAAGYLGSQLTQHLLLQGHSVIAYDIMFYGGEALLFGQYNKNLKIVKGDVRDQNHLKKYYDEADCLIYLAGIVGEPACNTNPQVSNQINLEAPYQCLKLAEQSSLDKVVFLSTCSNYGVSKPNELADENSDLNPLSEYAKAKIEIEKYLLNQYSKHCTILRLGTLCGISGRMRFDLLVNEIARACALQEEILIYTPQAWRPYLSMQDAVKCISKVATTIEQGADVFNIVAENLTKADLIDIVKKHYPQTPVSYVDKAPDLRDYRVSGEKFESKFGKLTDISIETTLISVAEAVKQGIYLDSNSQLHSAIPTRPFI